jgi:hypothetical protein
MVFYVYFSATLNSNNVFAGNYISQPPPRVVLMRWFWPVKPHLAWELVDKLGTVVIQQPF